jgi:hypothetical protein
MAKFKASEGVAGISVEGDYFPVDAEGCIEAPASYAAQIEPHGFTPYVAPDPAPRAKKAKAEQD